MHHIYVSIIYANILARLLAISLNVESASAIHHNLIPYGIAWLFSWCFSFLHSVASDLNFTQNERIKATNYNYIQLYG